MGHVIRLKEKQLVGGNSNEPVYPITATNAVYREGGKNLEEILSELGESVNKKLVKDVDYVENDNKLTITYSNNETKDLNLRTASAEAESGYPDIEVTASDTVIVHAELKDEISVVELPVIHIGNTSIVKLNTDDACDIEHINWRHGKFLGKILRSGTKNNLYVAIKVINFINNPRPGTLVSLNEAIFGLDPNEFAKLAGVDYEWLSQNILTDGGVWFFYKTGYDAYSYGRQGMNFTSTYFYIPFDIYTIEEPFQWTSIGIGGFSGVTEDRIAKIGNIVPSYQKPITETVYPVITSEYDSENNINVITFTNKFSDKISTLVLTPTVKNKMVYIPCKLKVGDDVIQKQMRDSIAQIEDVYYDFSWKECLVNIEADIYVSPSSQPTTINDCSLVLDNIIPTEITMTNPKGIYLCIENTSNIIGAKNTKYITSKCCKIPLNTIEENDEFQGFVKLPTELNLFHLQAQYSSTTYKSCTMVKCMVVDKIGITDTQTLRQRSNYQYLAIVPTEIPAALPAYNGTIQL